MSKVWTAAELEQMTPAQRDALFDNSIVTDLSEAPAGLLDRTRAKVTDLIAGADTPRQQ